MLRRLAWALAVATLASGCSSSTTSSGTDVVRSRASSSSTPVSTPSTAEACAFAPSSQTGEVTWVDDGRLLAVSPGGGGRRCLASGVGDGTVQWSGDGTKVLVGNATRTAAGALQEFARPFGLRLSRPTGRSVIQLGGERLVKYEAGGGDAKDITFVDQPGEAIYHPAGRAIVATGVDHGTPVLAIADNLGRNPRRLATGETAQGLTSLAFTASNALLFVGDHGDEQHLHRLDLATGKLTTVATEKAPGRLGDVTTSAFPGGGVAWTGGTSCDLVVEQDGRFVAVAGTPVASARPIGWLADRSLVVRTGCADPVGDLYAVTAGAPPRLLVAGVANAAVRAVMPFPEAAPATVPDQAPA